jgi:hypothetical protein
MDVLSFSTEVPPDFTILWTARKLIHGAVTKTVSSITGESGKCVLP